ncbi:hypothetical protein EV1_018662 [Malus domestica]
MVQHGEESVGDMVGMADGLEAHGEGGVVVRENGGKEDDPFDLIPIIESMMREQKGRKRSIWEVEYAKPGIEGDLTIDDLLE